MAATAGFVRGLTRLGTRATRSQFVRDFVQGAAEDDPAWLYALWDEAAARSRARLEAALAAGGLAQHVHLTGPDGEPVSLRRLVVDMIEEYGRHTGHADLLREAVDGRVGEDPPDDWRP